MHSLLRLLPHAFCSCNLPSDVWLIELPARNCRAFCLLLPLAAWSDSLSLLEAAVTVKVLPSAF